MTMPPEGSQNLEGNEKVAEEGYVRMKREDITKLEESAKKAGDAERLQKENLFLKNGIPTDTPLGQMFFKSYEGELNAEAIKAAAQEIGLVDKSTENPPIPEGETKATDERRALANNATPGAQTVDKHPSVAALEKAEEIIKLGGTFEQAGAGFLNTKMAAWNAGDKRAVKDPKEAR